MGCDPFTITVAGDMTETLEKIRTTVTSMGGSFSGDGTSGSIASQTPVGQVEGDYSISGNEITITITKKPIMVPCGMIETKMREFFQ